MSDNKPADTNRGTPGEKASRPPMTGKPEEAAAKAPPPPKKPVARPRRRWGLIVLGVAALLVVLLIVLLVIARVAAPGIARSQGEKFLSELLQTEVTIGKVRLSVFRGSVTVEDFRVAVPEGFEGGDMLRVDRLYANAALLSLMSSRPHLRDVSVEGIHIRLDTRGDGERSLMRLVAGMEETLEEWDEEGEEEDEEEKEEDDKEKPPAAVRVSRMHLADMQIHIHDAYAWREPLVMSFTVEEAEMRNVRLSDDTEGHSGEVTELRARSVRFTGTDRYRHPLFLEVPEFQLGVELERLLQTLPQPDIRVAHIEKHGTRLYLEHFESEEGDPGQNVREYVHLLLNAVTLGPPARLGEKRERTADLQVADAPAEPGEESAPQEEEPAPEDSEAGEEGPWGSIALGNLLFDDMRIEAGEVNAAEEDRMVLREGRIEVTDFTLPHEPGRAGSLLVRLVPVGPESLVQLTASGGLGDAMFQERVDHHLEVSEFGLVGLPNVKSGILNANFEGQIEDGRMASQLRFRLRSFDLEEKDAATRAVVEGLRVLDTINAPAITVPIRLNLAPDEGTRGGWTTLLERLIGAILGSIGSPIGRALEEAGHAVEELERGLDELGRGIGEGARFVEGGVREVEGVLDDARGTIGREGERAGEVVRDAEGAIRGIFGQRNSDSEDEEEDP